LTRFNEFQRNEKRFAIKLTHLATAGLVPAHPDNTANAILRGCTGGTVTARLPATAKLEA
jgi:hypothetical protein